MSVHTSHVEAGKGGRVSLRSAPFASGEQWGPVSCAKASQEELAEDLYMCVCGVCGCVYLLTNFSPLFSCTVSRLFITLHKNKLQVHWVKIKKKVKCQMVNS
jgi:hypothetical protein